MVEGNNILGVFDTYQSIDDEVLRNNIFICNFVISCLVKSNNFGKVMNLFEQMKLSGL